MLSLDVIIRHDACIQAYTFEIRPEVSSPRALQGVSFTEKHLNVRSHWYEQVWNHQRECAFGDRASRTIPRSTQPMLYASRGSAPTKQAEIEQTILHGDVSVARCVISGVHTGNGLGKEPNGRPARISAMKTVREGGGNSAKTWNNFDFAAMFQQWD